MRRRMMISLTLTLKVDVVTLIVGVDPEEPRERFDWRQQEQIFGRIIPELFCSSPLFVIIAVLVDILQSSALTRNIDVGDIL